MASSETREMLEDENDRLMDEMAGKIDTLKSVSDRLELVAQNSVYYVHFQLSIDIGDEVRGQNRFLANMVSPQFHSLFQNWNEIIVAGRHF